MYWKLKEILNPFFIIPSCSHSVHRVFMYLPSYAYNSFTNCLCFFICTLQKHFQYVKSSMHSFDLLQWFHEPLHLQVVYRDYPHWVLMLHRASTCVLPLCEVPEIRQPLILYLVDLMLHVLGNYKQISKKLRKPNSLYRSFIKFAFQLKTLAH